MGLMLDSSLLIAAERGRFDMETFVEAEAPMDALFIASITASELLHGVHRATPERRENRKAYVESVISRTPILPFDLPSARRHGEL